MISLKDVLALLDRWPAWKRITGTPDRMDELERRVARLEDVLKIPAKKPGASCPYCGETTMRKISEAPQKGGLGHLGVMEEVWQCGSCDKQERKTKAA